MAQHEDARQRRDDKKAKTLAKKHQAEIDSAVAHLLTTPQGRRYLYWLLEIGSAIGVNPMSRDSHETAFRCGEQNVGQRIMAHIIDVNPAGFTTMLVERENERQAQAVEKELGNEDVTGTD